MVGKTTALLTFTGRTSGRSYTTPISYWRDGTTVVLSGHASRQWWRNLAADPACRIRLAGVDYAGTAQVLRGEAARPHFVTLLAAQPVIAKASGIAIDANGKPNPDDVTAALADSVVVVVTVVPRDDDTTVEAVMPEPAGIGLVPTAEAIFHVGGQLLATPIIGRRRRRWGVSEAEAAGPLPGDELVPDEKWSYTYGVAIDASPESVWPWVAQVGQGRGGFYTYQTLENLLGCQIRNTVEILPDFQHPADGDPIYLHPDSPPLTVAVVDPPRALVLHGTPAEVGGDEGFATSTWQFCIIGQADGTSRLLTRGRSDYSAGLVNQVFFGRFTIEPVGFVMSRKMLIEIKRLAEITERSGIAAMTAPAEH